MSNRPDVQEPDDGTGPLNRRRYRVRIDASTKSPAELLDVVRVSPNTPAPTDFAVFDPPPGPGGLSVGDRLTVLIPGPWDGPVVVAAVEPRLLRLETRQGHMEAGRIEFSAIEHGAGSGQGEPCSVEFSIESVARSGDQAFDLLYHQGRIAKLVQTEMWVSFLESIVRTSGGRQAGRVRVETDIYLGTEDEDQDQDRVDGGDDDVEADSTKGGLSSS